jgi:RHS repeat-associated protein
MISASGSGWSETYGYDSFGNLLSKTPTGTAPTLSQAVSATTNQIVGQTYDANGNQLSGPLASVTYDPENRILTAPSIEYAYDSTNKRIWKGTISGGAMTAQEVYFYGLNGHKLGTYGITANGGSTPYLANSATTLAVFFRTRRVGITTGGTTTAFIQDRLGSQGNYYPYGEARGTVPEDAVGFATYIQDSTTALDYADQRYYANNFGRFMSPDAYQASATSKEPVTWNRYSYTQGDPVNRFDITGRRASRPGGPHRFDCEVIGGCSEASGEGVGDVGDGDVDEDDPGGGGIDGLGFDTSDFLTDDDGKPIKDDQGNSIVGDPTTTNDAYSTTVSGDDTGAGTNSSDTGDLNTAVTGSLSFFTPPYMLGGQINGAVIPTGQNGKTTYCLGASIGVGTPGKSGSAGVLYPLNNPVPIRSIVEGWSFSFSLQLTVTKGGQLSYSPGTGWAVGPTTGTPGASATYGWNKCR